MSWTCAAIDHGVTIFPNGKIGPCCLIDSDYLKPIGQLNNPDRFTDLKTEYPPSACVKCISAESNNLPSYRTFFNSNVTSCSGLQFVDIRNSNLCNLKCRYCGPHFSSQWAQELGHASPIVSCSIEEHKNILLTESLHWMYFTGGEPLILADHWAILEELIATNQAHKISLLYNSNLTSLKYKDKNIVSIWKQFKKVTVNCSIDAVGLELEYIRSGANWNTIDLNIQLLKKSGINIIIGPVVSILNVWNLETLFVYAQKHKIKVNLNILEGPDYLALDVIPDELKQLALDSVLKFKEYIPNNVYARIIQLINNNINQCLFNHTLNHVLLLDSNRNEKLFDLLPFKQIAKDLILKNNEHQ